MTRIPALAATAAATALLLSGCGTTEPAADVDGSTADAITITDARGETIELDGPATRVVGTEWNVVEHLIALGVAPVGVADIEGYSTWVQSEPLEGEPEDIGTRGEPSVETVAGLQPDLIVATTDLPDTAVAQLEEVAPVLVLASADAARPLEQMYENVELIAQATGTEDEAETVIGEFEAALEEGKAALAEAGYDGAPVAFSDGWVASNQVSIRPFVSGSVIAAVNEELGLTTPWELEGDAAYGLASTDVEGLTALGEVDYLYITNGAEADFTETLAGNAVWESLPFVQQDRVHRLPDGIWMFGGPSSMQDYAEAVVEALTA